MTAVVRARTSECQDAAPEPGHGQGIFHDF